MTRIVMTGLLSMLTDNPMAAPPFNMGTGMPLDFLQAGYPAWPAYTGKPRENPDVDAPAVTCWLDGDQMSDAAQRSGQDRFKRPQTPAEQVK